MLELVPPAEPSPKQAVIERVKRWCRPNGMIQCARCGSRTILNTVNGAFVKNGRKQGGTKIDIDVCFDCHRQGIYSPMLPEVKRIK